MKEVIYMKTEITLKELQKRIFMIDHKNDAIDKYFYKLLEEVGELAEVIRKNKRFSVTQEIKGTIEEELYDVLYYIICIANIYGIDLETCGKLKEKINASKYNRLSIFEE